jgi:hypothetical protein
MGNRFLDFRIVRFPTWPRSSKVYVDAKIVNMHDPNLPREAYVGYIVERNGRHSVKRVDATESDDAEVLAILYAADELKDTLGHFTIVCDHESVVAEAKKDTPKRASELMERLRQALRDNPSIRLEVLQTNPAHRIVTEYANMEKNISVQPQDAVHTPQGQ